MEFDRKVEYQLGFFFAVAKTSIPRDVIVGLAKAFEPAAGGEHFRIRFGDATLQDGFAQHGTQVIQVPTAAWGSGVWRMAWSPLRLDIHVDALQYADVASRPLPLDSVIRRVTPGLISAARALSAAGLVANRLVAIQTVERMVPEGEVQATLGLVARQYFGPDVASAIEARAISDLGARVDWGGTEITAGESTPLHRIESVGTQLAFSGTSPQLTLRCQWDVNTSPARGPGPLSEDSFEAFFLAASRWITSRVSYLQGGRHRD
jgi:hypothetical protein